MKMEICSAYISKYNSNRETQITLLPNYPQYPWYYLAVKILSALLRGTTTKHNGNFYC